MSDMEKDQLIMFQNKYFWYLVLFNICIGTCIPCYFWKEAVFSSVCSVFLAFAVLLNHTQLINSLNHCWGWKPYDTEIEPTFTRFSAYMTLGEGYHNFHHVFPTDYSASEFKWADNYNPSTLIIDALEYIGWVKNKRTAKPELIQERRLRNRRSYYLYTT